MNNSFFSDLCVYDCLCPAVLDVHLESQQGHGRLSESSRHAWTKFFPGFRIGIEMVQNYAWTHRNPARYHSTTRLIIIPLYFFCLEVRSFRRFFFLWSRCCCFPVGRFGCPGPALHGDSCQVSELATRTLQICQICVVNLLNRTL